jgi:serine/threonine-protein kinase
LRVVAALSSAGPVRQELEQLADPDVQASLAHLGAPAPQATVAHVPPSTLPPHIRFQILRPHARGGLGEIFVARDQELNREVALKEIQEGQAHDPDSRARFLREAKVTGGLEHPGVVPVYGLGSYPDGRPFYAMRLVKGDSLQEAIKGFHQAEGPGRDAGARAMAFRRLLGRFVDVCNAVAYAHSRGVLHRDLKPGNVMLGPYGETLVVDWGLAKTVGRPEGVTASPEGTLRPASASDSAPTQAGAALGTPPFMSPEQAAGRVDQLGPASDVYSLGATLYCLLTGRAPFARGDVGEVLHKIQKADFPRPRQVKRNVPPALEAVCLKAMALRPEDRYPSARALADDIEHWLADEPVTAYREPWRVRSGRWVRRHKPAVAAAAAALVVAVVLGGLGGWHLTEQAARQRRGVESALEDVALLQQQARWAEARVALDQAQSRLGKGGAESLRARLEQARRELDLVARLDAIRLKRATWVKQATWVKGHFDYAGADQEYAQAFQAAGMAEVGGDAAAAAAWVRATWVREALVAGLDDWAACTSQRPRRAWVLEVARGADPDPWRDRVRDPAAWDDTVALARLAEGPQAAQQSPQLLGMLGRLLVAVGRDRIGLLRRAQEQHPGDFWLNFYLGWALQKGHQPTEAVGYYRAALAVRPATPAVYNNLGVVLCDQGKLEEAATAYRQAIALDSKLALAHNNLGNALSAQGKLEEAAAEYRRAIALDPKDADAHYNLGNILSKQGKLEEAVAAYRAALRLEEDYAEAHCNLGLALLQQGQLGEALAEFKRGHELGTRRPDWPYSSDEWVGQCQSLVDLEARLPAILKGEDQPANVAECLSLGQLCALKKRYAEAARFYADAFAAEVKLPEDPQAGQRYKAAVCAALAGCGESTDAPKLDEQRTRLRKQALDWLRADLTGWARQLETAWPETPAAAQKALTNWRQDKDLAAVRSQEALARLPAEERQNWQGLWADVAEALGQAEARARHVRELEVRLPALVSGEAKPADVWDLLTVARLATHRQRQFAATARLLEQFLAANPTWAERLPADPPCYYAACCAAMAAAGEGPGAGALGAAARRRLRRQAMAWLREELSRQGKRLAAGAAPDRAGVAAALAFWQVDGWLAGLREAAALDRLPAEERQTCAKLWTDVAALLEKARGKASPEK